MNCRKYLWLGTFIGVPALTLFSAQLRPLPLAELSQSADLVVLGTVKSKACQRDEAGRIFTRVELSVSEIWKGSSTNTALAIVHGGGAIGNEHAEVSGQVEYNVGEDVVAFLVFNPRGELVTLGLCQGEFRVWSDAATGEKLARNIFHGGPATTNAVTLAAGRSAPAVPSRLTLHQLKQAVTDTNR